VGEAMRDLVRARADAKKAMHAARRQLHQFLMRHGRIWSGKTHWSCAHLEWIRAQRFEQPAQQCVLGDYIRSVESAKERVDRYDGDLVTLLPGWTLHPVVEALQALRGVSTVLGTIIVAELGDLRRFRHPRDLMAYVGLVPSEDSSGPTRRRGGITRAGNAHARFALVEAAWAYRFPPQRGPQLRARSRGLPQSVQDIAWKAQQRLYRKYLKLGRRGKAIQKVMAAIGRELVGFIWAIAQEVNRAA
jgi:transposase